MSGLPPKPEFDSRDDDRRSSPRRLERTDNDRRASSSRAPPPLADSYVAPAGDTYVPRHDERPRRPSPPLRSWREPQRRSPPPRRDEWRQRDEPIDRRRDYPPRSRDYPRGGPRDRDWRRDRDYDDRDRHYSRRSPSPYDRDRRWTSRGPPSPRRPTYDYRRRSPPHHSRRSASPPRYRKSSPGRREDGRFSPRRPPARVDDREGRPTHRRSRSRSRTRSRTPHSSIPQVEVTAAGSTSEVAPPAPVERVAAPPKVPSPRGQKSLDRPDKPPEDCMPKPSMPTETIKESTIDADVTMVDIQPPTQPKAFSVSTIAPPTQPKNFDRLPPTGPRSIPTAPEQPHPHQQPTTPSASTSTQDLKPAVPDIPTEEKPEIKLPEIKKFVLPNPNPLKKDTDQNPTKHIDNTIDELLRRSYIMRAEYGETLKATRKAIHEQEMAEIELGAAKMRREVADSQLEKARFGLLGIDFDGVSGLAINE